MPTYLRIIFFFYSTHKKKEVTANAIKYNTTKSGYFHLDPSTTGGLMPWQLHHCKAKAGIEKNTELINKITVVIDGDTGSDGGANACGTI
jgi:hypothetical protein